MPPKSERTIDVSLPLEQASALAKQVLWSIRANISPLDPKPGIILAKTGFSWRSDGEDIRVTVTSMGGSSRVHIQSQSSRNSVLIDWGKNAENVRRFEQGLLPLANSARDSRS